MRGATSMTGWLANWILSGTMGRHDAPSVVVVVTGVIEKEELDGSATRYEDFTIWEWDPVLAPLPE